MPSDSKPHALPSTHDIIYLFIHEMRLSANLSPESIFQSLYYIFSFDSFYSIPKPWMNKVMWSGSLSLGL